MFQIGDDGLAHEFWDVSSDQETEDGRNLDTCWCFLGLTARRDDGR